MPTSAHAAAPATAALPALREQAERLISLGVHELAGLAPSDLRDVARAGEESAGSTHALLVVHPSAAPASTLAPLLRRDGKPGFVVDDMHDVDRFAPLETIGVPDSPLYVVTGLDRGDHLSNWSPHEALAAIEAEGRTPLLLAEGIHWVLQAPAVLERNQCFMTIGSRLRKSDGALDTRTPALWISGGTGRDGRERRNAAKVGWCWAGNRHTWLGFASAVRRTALA